MKLVAHNTKVEMTAPDKPGHGSVAWKKVYYELDGVAVAELYRAEFTMADDGDAENGPNPTVEIGPWELVHEGCFDTPIETMAMLWCNVDKAYDGQPLW